MQNKLRQVAEILNVIGANATQMLALPDEEIANAVNDIVSHVQEKKDNILYIMGMLSLALAHVLEVSEDDKINLDH